MIETPRPKWIAAVVAALIASALGIAKTYKAEGNRWWTDVSYLASDEMRGRNTGSADYDKAAQYVVTQYKKAGLKPGVGAGYEQMVKFDVKQIIEDHSRVALVRDGRAEPLQLGEDATILLAGDVAPDVDAAAVFVGYGLQIPEARYDDLTGVDLRNKIAVYITGAPKKIDGALASHYQSLRERWKALKAAGAIGVVTIPNPKSSDIPWARAALARFQPAMSLADGTGNDGAGLQFSLRFNSAHADKLLVGTRHTIVDLLDKVDKDEPLPHFLLTANIRAHVTVKRSIVESPNVLGILPGHDTKLKEEYVVLSAHLDHVGVGEPINGDPIYNGAMDNASGVASMLEVARMIHEQKLRFGRSMILLAVCGEEKGLLGSQYFAAHPTVPIQRIAADVNLDMFLPLFPLKSLEVMGLNESTLGEQIRVVGGEFGLAVNSDREPQRNRFIRSDQYSFIQRGVPSLALKFGFDPGSPEAKIAADWIHDRYHAPSDDLNQPVDKEAAAKFNEVVLALVQRIAADAARPQWKPDSFFRRFAN